MLQGDANLKQHDQLIVRRKLATWTPRRITHVSNHSRDNPQKIDLDAIQIHRKHIFSLESDTNFLLMVCWSNINSAQLSLKIPRGAIVVQELFQFIDMARN